MLNSIIDNLQAKFPPNRLVALAMALLIPTVITPAAAFVAVWAPTHLPGLPAFSTAQLTAFGIAGASAALLAATTAGYKWIDGWQRHEGAQYRQGVDAIEVAQRELERFHEKEVALIRAADSPERGVEAIEQLLGGRPLGLGGEEGVPPEEGSPSATVASAAVPPPPPQPAQSPPVDLPPPPADGPPPVPSPSDPDPPSVS